MKTNLIGWSFLFAVYEVNNADCVCRYYERGCYIDYMFPPPRGYKCHCTPVYMQAEGEKHYRIHDCTGKAMMCDAYEQKGCTGCSQEECCDAEGDCKGYNRGGNDNAIETKVVVVTEPLECPPQNNVDVDINISELKEGETGVDVDVTFDKANGTSLDDGNDGSGDKDSDVDEGNEDGSGKIEDGSGKNEDGSGDKDSDVDEGNEDGSGENQNGSGEKQDGNGQQEDSSGENDSSVDVENEEGSSNGTNTYQLTIITPI